VGKVAAVVSITEWAQRWNVPPAALAELARNSTTGEMRAGLSEAAAQSQVRLQESQRGNILMRNNNGACTDATGRHIRFGLMNDSEAVNKKIKSSDLIGITPVCVKPEHVGMTHGIFTAIEMKRGGWRYTGTKREKAQLNFLLLVKRNGGIARFSRGACADGG
jgi:hypothetical protein